MQCKCRIVSWQPLVAKLVTFYISLPVSVHQHACDSSSSSMSALIVLICFDSVMTLWFQT